MERPSHLALALPVVSHIDTGMKQALEKKWLQDSKKVAPCDHRGIGATCCRNRLQGAQQSFVPEGT